MLHVWLIPALAILILILVGFYLMLKFRGGTGVRTDGRAVVDKPDDDDLPPG